MALGCSPESTRSHSTSQLKMIVLMEFSVTIYIYTYIHTYILPYFINLVFITVHMILELFSIVIYTRYMSLYIPTPCVADLL